MSELDVVSVRGTEPPWVLKERVRRADFREQVQLHAEIFYPFLRPCRNRVLLVADGGLDFSERDFGLAVFVRTLLDGGGWHVRHEVTLAHINNVGPSSLMDGEARVAGRIARFRFDDPDHFAPDRYDVVMLFGISTFFSGRGTDSTGNPYPNDRLADPELRLLCEYMDGGGGLFATGDHGALGKALGATVPRARNMRLWDSTHAQLAFDEVSMSGPRRNDTNRGSGDFDFQSDDVPQQVIPTMYHSGWIFRLSYPHPLLCGPHGVIRVMPDHPHEGECVTPRDTELEMPFGGSPEYPPATDPGASRPLPEVISRSTVPAGNTSSSKMSTQPQTFGGICAYDGHRAGVGRVATDATWHHFVNINLVGMQFPSAPQFDAGFLASAAGQAHLASIRAYYRNLVTWLARPERIACMNARLSFWVVFESRVLESVLSSTRTPLERISPLTLRLIGFHARDVLGRAASQCQSLRLVLDIVLYRVWPRLLPEVDPWAQPERPVRQSVWIDGSAMVDIALGGALVGLREAVEDPLDVDDVDPDRVAEIMAEAGARSIELARRHLAEELEEATKLLQGDLR